MARSDANCAWQRIHIMLNLCERAGRISVPFIDVNRGRDCSRGVAGLPETHGERTLLRILPSHKRLRSPSALFAGDVGSQ